MSKPLSPGRLEAFSDGVIAVIITIMVFELHVPSKEISNHDGLLSLIPLLTVYLLSFVQTGIDWVNHHYLVDDLDHVTHGILWSNLAFRFCLSLIPFATTWIGNRGISSFSVSLYSHLRPARGLLDHPLHRHLPHHRPTPRRQPRQAGHLHRPLSRRRPRRLPLPHAALGMIFLVAILWLLPPRKVVEQTRTFQSGKHSHSDQS